MHNENSGIVYGKVPPQVREFEKAVLGAVMLERNALGAIEGTLTPDMFYVDAHTRIFQAILSLSAKGRPVDILEVVEQLRSSGDLEVIGGPYFVTALTSAVVSSANIEYHAGRIVDAWKRRQIISYTHELQKMAYSDEFTSDDCMVFNEKELTELSVVSESERVSPMSTVLVDVAKEVVEISSNKDSLVGVTSGFKSIDKITHGFKEQELIIIAARPGMGKTAFALNIARNAVMDKKNPVPVAFFSLEMSNKQLVKRMIAAESGVFLNKIITGRMGDYDKDVFYNSGIVPLSAAKMFFDETPAININQLKSKCRKLKRRHNIGLIIVDYLQLMSGVGKGKNREGEISEISRGLKAIGKELNIPVIALSQLSREVEKRENKEPMLADLRESGAIEQDADMVMFLYRPEYYKKNADENGESTRGLTKINIAKNRSGMLDNINLKADLAIQKFTEWEGEVPAAGTTWKSIGVQNVDYQGDNPF